jgi:5'-nucleotidase
MDWHNSRILVTNDDGIDADGLKILAEVAGTLSSDVWICAPATEQSGASHSLTMHRPVRLEQLGARRFSVDGTPTDCVLLAINHLLKAHKPWLVLSGINRGANIGDDVIYSGTIAAAMEATMLGVKAIALSLERREELYWQTPRQFAGPLIKSLAELEWPKQSFLSVNFPAMPVDGVKGVVSAATGTRKIGDRVSQHIDPRGRPYYWIGTMIEEEAATPGSDIALLRAGYITVSPLGLDLTDHRFLPVLEQGLR